MNSSLYHQHMFAVYEYLMCLVDDILSQRREESKLNGNSLKQMRCDRSELLKRGVNHLGGRKCQHVSILRGDEVMTEKLMLYN